MADNGKLLFGVDESEYRAWDRAHFSALKLMLQGKSLAHVRHYMDTPSEATPAMDMGKALHWRVFESHKFDYHVHIAESGVTRAQKAWREKVEYFDGKVILTSAEGAAVNHMAWIVRSHPSVKALFEARYCFEGSLKDGVHCPVAKFHLPRKGRPDYYSKDLAVLADLKSCQDASLESFQKAIYNFRYDAQAAFYRDMLMRAGYPVEHCLLIAVEKTEPFGCAVYRLEDDVLNMAYNDLDAEQEVMAGAYRDGNWPGYTTEVQDIALPPWAMRKHTEWRLQ